MGCRTGFYLVVFGEVASAETLPLVRELFEFVAEFEGEIPGAAPAECGNYLDQNLPMAKWLAHRYLERDLADIDEKHLSYQGWQAIEGHCAAAAPAGCGFRRGLVRIRLPLAHLPARCTPHLTVSPCSP